MTPRLSGTSAALHSIAFGNGSYVAVGTGGVVLKSPNASAWSRQPSATTNNLRGVSFGNGLFVAVGATGTIVSSPDGITWTTQASGITNRLNAIAFNGTAFVAVGNAGAILYSTNAEDWITLITGDSHNLNGVTGSGTFVAVGDAGTVLSSPDGLGWTMRTSGTPLDLNAVGHFAKFVAVGKSGAAITSPDGITWTVRYSGTTADLHGIAVDPVLGVGAVGDEGTFRTSSDGGVTWIPHPSETTNALRGIGFENGGFVAVGDSGTIQAGMVWVRRQSGVTSNLGSVVWGNNRFVAAGATGTLLTSTNGENWTSATSDVTNDLTVRFAGNRFLAFSYASLIASTNGIDWTAPVTLSNTLISVTYGNGAFLAIASYLSGQPAPQATYVALRSTDGTNWAPSATFGNDPVNDIAFGDNLFCVAGSQGNIFTSPDGVTWTTHNINVGGALPNNFTVIYVNGRFIVTSQAGALVISTNGSDWVVNGTNLGYVQAGRWCFGNNGYVAIGNSLAIGTSFVSAYLTSSDAVTVAARSPNSVSESPLTLNAVAFGNGTFVAVGPGGLITQSVPVPSLLKASNTPQGVDITLTGEAGRNVSLQSTTNLASGSWTGLLSLTNAPYSTNYVDKATNASQRFYRSSSL